MAGESGGRCRAGRYQVCGPGKAHAEIIEYPLSLAGAGSLHKHLRDQREPGVLLVPPAVISEVRFAPR